MSVEVTFDDDRAEAIVAPEYGNRVVFVVERRKVTVSPRDAWTRRAEMRWVVGLRGSTADGFSTHTQFEAACRSLLSRARRYDRAYAVPRGIAS